MIDLTTTELAALKDSPRAFYLLEFTAGSTYRFTTTDTVYEFESNNYLPGFIDEMPEIEITSDPRTNDLDIELSDPDRAMATVFLSEDYMNGEAKITKVYEDKFGDLIFTKNAFQGFLSDFGIDVETSTVTEIISSVWADFQKTSGIKTNAASQQRFYPNDTAFDHAANSQDKLYWGVDAPSVASTGGGGGVAPVFDDPFEEIN